MKKNKFPRIIFAGDREIAFKTLRFIIENGHSPIGLMVSDTDKASHVKRLIGLCKGLDSSLVLKGAQFRSKKGIELLKKLRPDYIIGVHFPYIIPKNVLGIPLHGVLNLHPAYLPYNRGWNTPTWAIWEGDPYGATLHFMDEGMDTGDIILQKKIKILPDYTADTLYARVLDLEFEIFKKAWPHLVSGKFNRRPQSVKSGSTHKKGDINLIREIDLYKKVKAEDLIRLLRALTTNDIDESAYFKIGQKKYHIQIKITER